MSRPLKCRRVGFMPGITYFKPAGIPLRYLEEVRLSIDEVEAIRLKDIEGLEQEQGAQKMNISRPTFQRVLGSARQKIADALLNGKAIKIEGGHFEMLPSCLGAACQRQQPAQYASTTQAIRRAGELKGTASTMNETPVEGSMRMNMKIAAVTEDGTTISQHFGRAPLYMVITIEEGKVVGKEERSKAGHHTFAGQHEEHHAHGERHGFDSDSQARHGRMADSIADCQVLIAGGMGYGAYESLKSRNIEPIVTDEANIDEAVKLYLEGKLPNLMERLH